MRMLLLVCVFGCWGQAKTIEFITGLAVGKGADPSKSIWSYQLHKMITDNLYVDGTPLYQDFEVIMNTCFGGGTVQELKTRGLLGTWSMSASTARPKQYQRWDFAKGKDKDGVAATWNNGGLPVKVVQDGEVETWYMNNYSAQYLRLVKENPGWSVKKLHDQALAASFVNDGSKPKPGYLQSPKEAGVFESQEGGDSFTLKGNEQTKSRHAIVYSGGQTSQSMEATVRATEEILKGLGYDSVDILHHQKAPVFPVPAGYDHSNWKDATAETLAKALKDMAAELKKNPQEEKALLLVEGHGAIEFDHRMTVLKDGDPPIPGEGYVIDGLHTTLEMPIEADMQALLAEEVPDGQGGFLYDDEAVKRVRNPFFHFAVYEQNVSGPVRVYLDDLLLGSVSVQGAGTYYLEIPLMLMGQFPWLPGGEMNLPIRFGLNSESDWFKLATHYDWDQDASFQEASSTWGLGIQDNYDQSYPGVPESNSLWLAGIGLALLGWRARRRK